MIILLSKPLTQDQVELWVDSFGSQDIEEPTDYLYSWSSVEDWLKAASEFKKETEDV